jgi:flagellin
MVAQGNLNTNSIFESKTIQQLTSGYRINSSGDDAAGLAIANAFRSSEAELTQGVSNANDGISTLQIVDGGMSNVSQMLDRLRTLATQSASQTFTGDRNVLNNEFQGLLTEINRQAQSIGMGQGGVFATSLSVYIGGGKNSTTGAFDASNGTVNFDLSNSAVDTQSLGLTGMQVTAGTSDLSAASNTSVANILANGANTEATAGNALFEFAGPGFSDGSQIKVSANLSGVTDVNTLVSAINTAITAAGNGNSAAATAFKAAGIVASVNTDANGGLQLAFKSSTSAFQVQAGDQMANALMGNFSSGTTGAAITSTVTGASAAAGSTSITSPGNIKVEIDGGGLTSPVTLSLSSASNTVALALADIQSQVAGNTALQAAGITASGTGGNPLVFTNSVGNQMKVMITGDTANTLGYGSFLANGANADYSSITGAALTRTSVYGNAHMQFSIDGGASNGNDITVDTSAGDATAATATGTNANVDAHGLALTVNIDGAGAQTVNIQAGSTTAIAAANDINTAAVGVTATVDGTGHLIITANAKGGHSVVLGGAAATAEGLSGTVTGQSRSAQSIADALNTGFAANTALSAAGLEATVTGGNTLVVTSANNTAFRANVGTTASTANIGFGTTGSAFTGVAAANSAATFDDANGTTNTGALTFNAMAYGGDNQTLTISATNNNGVLESKTLTLQNNATAETGESIDQAVSYINQQLQKTNNPTLQSIVAVKENVGGTEKINFLSDLKGFSVSFGASPNGNGFSGNAGATVASTSLGTTSSVSIDSQENASQALSAVAAAVTKLGTAQAAVGKGQNQLNYAIGLAQSQITNYSAAESRIRDADVAKQAANLTKAQVLQQASIAAMAQANSEPQALLSLLKG